jgi:hypothetical protein
LGSGSIRRTAFLNVPEARRSRARTGSQNGPDAVIVTLAVDTGFKHMSVSPFADL